MKNMTECIGGGLSVIEAGMAVDDRGQIQFCNGFDMKEIQRFYIVSNHQSQFIRAWHGHKKETKHAFVVTGAAIFAAVKINNWDNPAKDVPIQRFILSEKDPGILKIPAGFAHGFKTLTPDTKVMFFSTSSLSESSDDDYRYEYNYWDPWEVEPR